MGKLRATLHRKKADGSGKSERELAQAGIAVLEGICAELGCPTKLTDYVAADKIDVGYIVNNIQSCMAHIKSNPRPVSPELFEELLRCVL